MSTFTDTSVRISLATPEDLRGLSQKSLHIWVGAVSPLWAPFWVAASFGMGVWALGQGAARTLGGTLYDKDLLLAAKWPGFQGLPKPVNSMAADLADTSADILKDAAAATTETVEKTQGLAADAIETAATTALDATNDTTEKALAVADEAVETAVDDSRAITNAVAETTEAAAVGTVKAAKDVTDKAASTVTEAEKTPSETLDLLGNQPAKSKSGTRPLIDPVTEVPVVPAVAEAIAEPKIPMPKPAPRRPRKS
jgi:hypothetical protein